MFLIVVICSLVAASSFSIYVPLDSTKYEICLNSNNCLKRSLSLSKSTFVLFGSRDSLYTRRIGSKGGGQPNEIRSKRQERVGQLISSEIGRILHSGIIKGRDVEYVEDELRQRISVVKTDISPDLRQARVSVSIRAALPANTIRPTSSPQITNSGKLSTIKVENDDVELVPSTSASSSSSVDKRRAYSWLVRNTKAIRHTLAQRISHMKSCPTLTFVQVDVAAAVDVMYLIDKVISGQKRDVEEFLFDNEDDDFEDEIYEDDDGIAWEEINNDFFRK